MDRSIELILWARKDDEYGRLYPSVIEEVANLYKNLGFDTKIKRIREIRPVLEFEDKKFQQFRDLMKRLRKPFQILKNLGIVWMFVHDTNLIKKSKSALIEGYLPAEISPLPDGRVYQSVFVNKEYREKIQSHSLVELRKVRTEYDGQVLIYVDEIELIDKIKWVNYYQDFGRDMSKDYQKIMREFSMEKDIGDYLGAGTMSADNGLAYSIASDNKHAIFSNIHSAYRGLQLSLPPIFRKEHFQLKFAPSSNIFYKNKKISILCDPYPLYDFDESLKPLSYSNSLHNQTLSALTKRPQDVLDTLSLFQTENLITNIDEFEYSSEPFNLSLMNSDMGILDEEIWLWLISRRNFIAHSALKVNEFFVKNLSNSISDMFTEILPENCLITATKYSLMNEGYKRSFEGFCRLDITKDDRSSAKKFAEGYLYNFEHINSEIGIERSEKYIYAMAKDAQKRSGVDKKKKLIQNAINGMTGIAKKIPYNAMIEAIKQDFGFSTEMIEDVLNREWKHGDIAITPDRQWVKRVSLPRPLKYAYERHL